MIRLRPVEPYTPVFSQLYNGTGFNNAVNIPYKQWIHIKVEISGTQARVFIGSSRSAFGLGADPDCVLAKTTIQSDKDQIKKLIFGYSDEVSIFLNGRILFRGNSEYRRRSSRFLGIAGLNDSVFLPLKKGENELLLMVTENFGG